VENNIPIHPGGEADYKLGSLPAPFAPLAIPYVPFQSNNPPQYSSNEGLNRGTIFPGLDLPWANKVNRTNAAENTLLGNLTALEFAVDDLQLFLDTHPDDKDALGAQRYYIEESKAYREEYCKTHGPLTIMEAGQHDNHAWLDDPWPWDYVERMD